MQRMPGGAALQVWMSGLVATAGAGVGSALTSGDGPGERCGVSTIAGVGGGAPVVVLHDAINAQENHALRGTLAIDRASYSDRRRAGEGRRRAGCLKRQVSRALAMAAPGDMSRARSRARDV
jgi:hypothetical protein